MAKTTKSQNARILTTLENTGSITNVEAVSRGIKNLSARISELRADGVKIGTVSYKRKSDGATVAKYVYG